MIADKFIISLIVIVLCVSVFKANAALDYKNYEHEMKRSFGKQMYEELGLIRDSDISFNADKIEELEMSFLTYRRATFEEARALQLLVVDKFVQAINADEKIQPYLAVHPFTFKRATVSICFEGIGGFISDGTVARVSSVSELAYTSFKNHLVYSSHDPFKDRLIHEFSEPYEDALRLNEAFLVDPTTHQEKGYESEMDALVLSFARESHKKFGLKTRSIGGKWVNGIEEMGATFVVNQFVTQEEARQLLVEMSENWLSLINSNEKIRPYLKEYPFPASLLKMRFSIEETRDNEFPDVRIISMILDENLITYVQEIVHPLKPGDVFRDKDEIVLPTESYGDALKIVESHPIEFKQKFSSIFDNLKNWFIKFLMQLFFLLK